MKATLSEKTLLKLKNFVEVADCEECVYKDNCDTFLVESNGSTFCDALYRLTKESEFI